MSPTGRDRVLASTDERTFQEHLFNLAARGGWHGIHIRVSHGTLEGLHSLNRAFPRGADHDDTWGVPDLLLVHPERGLLLLPELKAMTGRLARDQRSWQNWLSDLDDVAAPVWRPADEDAMRALLLGGKA